MRATGLDPLSQQSNKSRRRRRRRRRSLKNERLALGDSSRQLAKQLAGQLDSRMRAFLRRRCRSHLASSRLASLQTRPIACWAGSDELRASARMTDDGQASSAAGRQTFAKLELARRAKVLAGRVESARALGLKRAPSALIHISRFANDFGFLQTRREAKPLATIQVETLR